MRNAWIIATGTELALGQSVDTNTAWIAQRLAALGVRAQRHVTVPDDRAEIRRAIAEAVAAADVIVITGGLGPTEDDLTREALSEAAGSRLVSDAGSLETIRAFFAARGREMSERNRLQALRPESARALENAQGTAPGLFVEIGGKPCFALPGVPFEMKAMFAAHVEPLVRSQVGGRTLLCRALHCSGLSESEVGGRIADLMARGRNPDVGTTASQGVVSVRIFAAGRSPQEAADLLEAVEGEVRRRLGDACFGCDAETPASAVGKLLAARGARLATAESCTGGLLGKLLTDTPGSSDYYAGGAVAYSNASKRRVLGVEASLIEAHGAVSEAVAAAMAEGARRIFEATFGLSITGVAGPAGGTVEKPVGTVYLGLATPNETRTTLVRAGSSAPRDAVRRYAAHGALNLLRLRLLADG